MPSVVWLLVVVFAAMVCITTLLLLLVHREDPDALQSIVFPERPSQTPSPSTAPLPSPLPLTSPLQMAVHPPTRPTPPVSVSWQPQLVTSAEPPPLPLPPPDAASREIQQREEELLEAEARLAWKSSLGHVSAVESQRPWRALPDAGSTLSTAWALGTSASAFVSVSSDESGAWPATPPNTPAHALPRAPASPPMEGWQAAGGWAWTPGPRGPSETDPDAPDPPPWGETLSTVVALHTAAEPDAASQMTPSSSASSSASPSTESAIMSLVSDAASMAVSLAPATPPPTPATGVSVVGTSHAGPRPPTAEWSSTAAAAIAMAAHAPASSPLSERPSDASAGPGSAFAPALRPVGASVSWAASADRPAPPDAETSAVSTSAFDSASSDAASGSAREAPEAQSAPPPTPPPPSRRSPRGALAAPTASTAPTASGDLARNAALASPAAGDQGAPAGFTRAMQALRGELESTERECERLRRHIAFISATRAALRRDVEAARAAPAHVDGDVGVASEGLASEGLVGEGLRRRLRLRARSLLPLPSASPICLADPPDHQ